MKTLTARLTQLGYAHAPDANSEADGKHQLFAPCGEPLGRFTAFEIIGILADKEKAKHK